MKKEAQELDNELSRLNIEKTKQALAQMALGGAGGGGGGRPDMAQAGGKDPQKLEEALKAGKEAVQGAGK